MAVELSEHAVQKLKILRRHRVRVSRKLVEDAVSKPDRVVPGAGGRQIAERSLDEDHVVRVVFIRKGGYVRVITTYPARRGRY